MLNRLRDLIAPPILRDETQNRAAALLNALIWMAFLLCAVLTGAIFMTGVRAARIPAVIFGAAVIILFLGLRSLMRRGRVRLASWVFIGLALVVSTLLIYSQGSLRTPFTILLALVIVAAGLLLGEWAAFATALYGALATLLLLLAEWRGFLGAVQPVSQLVMWIVYAAAFTILAGLLALTTRLVNRAFSHANENEQRLVESIRELMDVRASLEARVTDRTQEISHQVNQLQTATEVGSAIIALRSLDELLQGVPQLVSGRFGYDHVGLYLLDPAGEYVVLKASNSPGGGHMLAQSYKLAIGGNSIVGTVAQTHKTRIVSDDGQDTVYFQNPDLPETHSEIALPLAVGDKLLGVLDVQSTIRSAFSPIDAAVLKVVADQVAVAIENARLFSENENALDDIRRAYGELNRSAWGKLLSTRPSRGYRCDADGHTQPVSGEWPEAMVAAEESAATTQIDQQTLAVPVKFGDEVRGVIRLTKPEDGTWSSEEIEFMEDLSEQLFVALESARLYQETQRRAERERLAAQITARMRATNDPQTILQTAVQELRRALQAQHAQAVLQAPKSDGNGSSNPDDPEGD